MAQNENALGAPTEGLGQNVTFAFGTQQRSPQAEAGAAIGVQATLGINGNTQFRSEAAGVKAPPPDPTIAFLFRAGEEILRPQLQQRQTEQYVAGMQKAMQGEAIQDIAANRPWYSKLFGETDVIEGARQFYSDTRAQTAVAGMEDQMPEIRKLEPAAAQKFFADTVTKSLTGDKPTDAAIMQGFVRAMPAVMRRQAKEHYGYKQEQASTAQAQNMQIGSERLQKLGNDLSAGYVTPDEYEAQRAALLRSWGPVMGQDEENYQKTATASMLAMAERGELHALNALRQPIAGMDGKPVSFLDGLTQPQRNAVEQAVNASEQRQVNKFSFDWNGRITDLKVRAALGGGGKSPDELYAEGEAINADFQKRTGSTIGVISPSELGGIKERSGLKIAAFTEQQAAKAEANRLAASKVADKQAAEAQAENEKNDVIVSAAARGDLGLLSSQPGYSDERINQTFRESWLKLSPGNQVQALALNMTRHNWVSKPIANEMDGQINSLLLGTKPTLSGGMQAAAARFDTMYNQSPSLALAYHPTNGPKLMKYRSLRDAGMQPQEAFDGAFAQPLTKQKVNATTLKAVTAEITSSTSGILPAWLGGTKLRPESVALLADLIGSQVETLSDANNDVTLSTKMALEAGRAGKKFDILGEHVVANHGSNVSLQAYLTGNGAKLTAGQAPLPTDKVGDVFTQAIHEAVSTHYVTGDDGVTKEVPGIMAGKKVKQLKVVRAEDRDGVPQLSVFAADEDGQVHVARISADSIFSLSARRAAAKDITSKRPQTINTNASVLGDSNAAYMERLRNRK